MKENENLIAPRKLKLLVTVVNREKAEFYTDLLQSFEVNFQTSMNARGTASKETLRLLGIGESDKTVIIARADLTITLGRLLGILIFYGVKALKQFLSIQNKRKGGNQHE